MAKKTPVKNKTAVKKQPAKQQSPYDKIINFFSGKYIQLIIIAVIGFISYSNSIGNDFATDDNEYYFNNQFVLKGISGINDLLTKESMYGYYANSGTVSGGRWRPLSLITFALEKEYFNADPHISHFINLLLLIITCIIMLFFLRKYVFITSPVAAFIVTLLFIIHPVHTEAVSHIKSRDELMSWLFLVLTMHCSLNFITKRKYMQLTLAVVFYCLALLSKENGITFIIILPLTIYCFTNAKWRTIALTTLPMVVVGSIYALVRSSIVAVKANAAIDIVNAPYYFATPVQHFATALMLLGKYLLLLFYPNPLSSDYTYNTIPYVSFSDWRVWLSILIQAALLIYAIVKLKDKSLIAYGILFYFCSIFIVSNLFIDVGTFVGERFLYQPSFGFCIALVAAIAEFLKRIKLKDIQLKFFVIAPLLIVVVLLCGFQTYKRNADWQNSRVLWETDIHKVHNSISLHESLGYFYMNDGIYRSRTPQECKDDFAKALAEDDSAIAICPNYPITWFNMGYFYLIMHDSTNAENAFEHAVKADSNYSQGYNGLGTIAYNEKKYLKAMAYFNKASKLDSTNAEYYFNMGLCDFYTKHYRDAVLYFNKALQCLNNLQDVRNKTVNPQTVEQFLLNAEQLLKMDLLNNKSN